MFHAISYVCKANTMTYRKRSILSKYYLLYTRSRNFGVVKSLNIIIGKGPLFGEAFIFARKSTKNWFITFLLRFILDKQEKPGQNQAYQIS
jgi:hypothetical protein